MFRTGAFTFNLMSLLRLNIKFIYLFAPFLLSSSVHSVDAESTLSIQKTLLVENELTVAQKDEVIYEEVNTILPISITPVRVSQTSIPLSSKFLVFQVHAYNYNLTLSYNQTLIAHYHVNGTNVGLVVPLLKGQVPEVYITNFNISRNVSALIAVLAYGINAPIPGGCNMVFSVETSPFLQVSYDRAVVTVDVQPASPPINSFEDCDYSSVDIEMYHFYLPEREYESESYFAGIKKMLTVDRIHKYGTKVNDPLDGPTVRRLFSAYPGTGTIYGVIAVYDGEFEQYTSAYVPSATYACSTVFWADTCQVLTTTFAKVLCAIIFFLGLFVCLCGHRFFVPQICIHSFLTGGIISLIVLSPYINTGLYPLSVFFGIGFATIIVFFWHMCGWPLFHIFMVSLNVGFLLASVVFYAGLGDVDIMVSDINYWISFAVFVLTAPFVLVYVSNKACIIASGLLGAYAVIIPIDHYIGSNLKFIVLNTIRRATVPEFRNAVISPPYEQRDLALTVAWFLLSVVGIFMQIFLQKNRPPFPPPPRDFGRYCCCLCHLSGCCPTRRSAHQYDERTPLLVDARIPSSTPPDGYDDVFEPNTRPSAPSAHLLITH